LKETFSLGNTATSVCYLTQECGSPDALLNMPWSIFNKLVDDTGPQSSAQLRKMAAEGPEDEPPHQNWGP